MCRGQGPDRLSQFEMARVSLLKMRLDTRKSANHSTSWERNGKSCLVH